MSPPGHPDPWLALAGAARRLPELAEALRGLPWPAAAAALLAGAAVLGLGARARRPLAAAGGALVGLAAGTALTGWLGTAAVPASLAAVLGAVALGALAGLFPPLFIFAAGALPGALLASTLPERGQPWYVLVGLAMGGLMALALTRWVAAVTAAGLGAALLAAGLFGAAGDWPPVRLLASHPVVLATLLMVVTVSGAAFQHAAAWRPSGRAWRRAGAGEPEEASGAAEPS